MTALDLAMIQAIDERVRLALKQERQYGTIVERAQDGTAQVVFDGSSQAMPCYVFGDVQAWPGDRVGAIRFDANHWIVIGTMTHRWPEDQGDSKAQGAGGTTTSTTYAGVPNSVFFTFVKRWDTTRVRAVILGEAFSGGGFGAELEAGLNFASTAGNLNYMVAYHVYNTAGEHGPWHGLKYIPGSTTWTGSTLPAGTYTVTVMWRRAAGAGTLTVNNGDEIAAFCTEVAP